MAGLTFTTADAVLKEDYLPAVREQLNDANVILAQVEKNTKDIEGRRAVLALHIARSSGVGARAEGGTLPTAGNQGYAEERVPVRYVYGRLQVSGPVIAAMKSDAGSFVRAVDSEMKGLTNDLKRDVNRQLWGTTDGIIASAGTTGNSTTLQLASTTSNAQIRQIVDAGTIDLGTTADSDAVAAGLTVSGFSYANKTVTVSSAVTTTVASSHKVFRAGVFAGGASNSTTELTGLQTIVAATGAVHNVNPSTAGYGSWVAYVDSNSGTNRSISENLCASVMHNVEILGGEPVDLAVSSDGVHRSFANLLTSLKRVNMPTLELKGGFKGLSMTAGGGEVPLVWDRDCPENQVFFLNTKHLALYATSDWDFMDKDGAVLSRVSNTDAYEAVLFRYMEFATDKRMSHGLLKDITAS